MAWACEHVFMAHYSNGLCQRCYLSQYYVDRKETIAIKKKARLARKALMR